MKDVKTETKETYRDICSELDVSYSSFMRWKSLIANGLEPAKRPGPAKVGSLDIAHLCEDIGSLAFGRERTGGTGALYAKHQEGISRRDLQRLVQEVREDLGQIQAEDERRIEWLAPGLVWSMDDLEKGCLLEYKGHVNLLRDLASRRNLGVLGDDVMASGMRIALNLEGKFKMHGAPLFLKMDGGGNFRSREVYDIMDAYMVIPLVSPPYYPPYNGGVERGHQEILAELGRRIGSEQVCPRVFRLECESSGHTVDHIRRDSLGGLTACEVFESGRHLLKQFGRRERKEAYEEIKAIAVDIAEELREYKAQVVETAFRFAAETWMQQKQLIRVSRNGKVLPSYYRFQSH